MRSRKTGHGRLVLLGAFFLFLALGSFTWPGEVLSYNGFIGHSGLFRLLYTAVLLYVACSLVPPVLVLAAATSRRIAASRLYLRLSSCLLLLLTVVALAGFPAVFVYSAVVTPHEFMYINFARIGALFLQVVICRKLLFRVTKGDGLFSGGLIKICLLPVVAFCLWSLGSGIAAAGQAYALAEGGPYCIGDASHPGRRYYGEIDSVLDLRGVDLVVSATGYKHNSYWFYHAILVTPESSRSTYWNWSIQRMTFTPVTPRLRRLLIGPIDNSCDPKVNFISWLLWPF